MEQKKYQIIKNTAVADRIYHLRLQGDSSALCSPGQFAAIKIPGSFLRRPFSVCDWDADGLDIYYKVIGEGTESLASLLPGAELDILTGLGNGFRTDVSGPRPLLVGGGMGATPLYCLCRRLLEEGKHPSVILGFASRADAILTQEFAALGVPLYLCSDDGSLGRGGFVTDCMDELDSSYFYSCGPEARFRAIDRIARTEGQFSFEARMGCGFGACMGCSCKTHKGNKRICKDGPILERSEILW